MEPSNDEVVELGNGDIVMWVDSGTLHLKCITRHGDPVELNADEGAEVLASLRRCLQRLD
jgi:hypothetical protein